MLGARRRAWGVAARCQSPTNRACSIRTIFSERSPSQQRLLQTTAHRPHVAIGTPFGRVTRRSLHAVVSEEPLAPLPSAQKPKEASNVKEGLRRVLSPTQAELLQQETSFLESMMVLLHRVGAEQNDMELLERTKKHLEELFMLVVVGEFNSGKSSFLNALLGKKYLKEGVTPTTSKITVVRYGKADKALATSEDANREVIYLPVDWLKDLSLVDTPGTNAILKYHQQITEHFIPHSDIVLFVTSADRAFSESEHQFLERIRQWKKKVVVVIQKIDLLEDGTQVEELYSFVAKGMHQLLDIQPRIFPVSAKSALKAKQLIAKENASAEEKAEADSFWKKSQWAELENYILNTLDSGQRAKLKLKSPLGVAQNLLTKYKEITESRMHVLEKDILSIQYIEEQLEEHYKEMKKNYTFHQNRIDNILLEISARGDTFFDQHLTLSNIFGLVLPEKIRGEFERTVVNDVGLQIERHVSDLIDWTIDQNSKHWRRVVDYAIGRATVHKQSEGVIGTIDSGFEHNRGKLLESMRNDVRSIVSTYDKVAEAEQITKEIKNAIYSTAAIGASAVGVGSLVAASLIDFTGIFGAGVLAITGLCIIPYKRVQVKKAFKEKIASLRLNMKDAIQTHFDRELLDNKYKIQNSVAPYTLYIKTETEKLSRLQTDIEGCITLASNNIHSIDLAFPSTTEDAEKSS
jgi:small GTP-binding protein